MKNYIKLNTFGSLTYLEIKNIQINNIYDLQNLRNQLEVLICIKSINKLQVGHNLRIYFTTWNVNQGKNLTKITLIFEIKGLVAFVWCGSKFTNVVAKTPHAHFDPQSVEHFR